MRARQSEFAVQALLQRLNEVAPELLESETPSPEGTAGESSGVLLAAMVEAARARPDRSGTWLLLVAVSGTLPVAEDVVAAQRRLELSSTEDAVLWLLETAFAAATGRCTGGEHLRLVRDGVVVDVDFTAKHDLQTGVQRVVRRLLPRWHAAHDVELAVWSGHGAALRELTAPERDRVLRWTGPLDLTQDPQPSSVLLVPWRCTVVLPEVPGGDQCARLASLARYSVNRVVAVGHDCIPVLSADLMPDSEPVRFVRYLTLVKHLSVVAGVSESAASEFRGFAAALPNQGIPGPRVVACPLAGDLPHLRPAEREETPDAEVVVVGSHEPRKNHLAVLHAAEVLWRRGLRFRLRFLGAGGWTTQAFDHQLDRLARAGRPVTAERGLDDVQLWAALGRARFSVFPSLHEGFGLPVVESLALGTPVIGTSYGSIAELAQDGGIVLVDPRDDDALVQAMERLLTDDVDLERLRDEATARPLRTWDAYAAELWQLLVEPA